MAFWSKRKKHEPWRLRQYGNNLQLPLDTTKPPPPFPPSHLINVWDEEAPESVRDDEDWETYMAGFRHGFSAAQYNMKRISQPQTDNTLDRLTN